MNCSKCNAEIADDMAFCGKCGTPVTSRPRFCGSCGKEFAEGTSFCVYCGKPLQTPPSQQYSRTPRRQRVSPFTALAHYANFSGRATRSEYWLFVLFQFLVWLVLLVPFIIILANTYSGRQKEFVGAVFAIIGGLFTLGMLIPNLAVTVRRFHDQGRSGWLILLGGIPFVGYLILLICMMLSSQPHDNEYGPY